jgi:hypothetical protein
MYLEVPVAGNVDSFRNEAAGLFFQVTSKLGQLAAAVVANENWTWTCCDVRVEVYVSASDMLLITYLVCYRKKLYSGDLHHLQVTHHKPTRIISSQICKFWTYLWK